MIDILNTCIMMIAGDKGAKIVMPSHVELD